MRPVGPSIPRIKRLIAILLASLRDFGRTEGQARICRRSIVA
jgi:hypothetical protein